MSINTQHNFQYTLHVLGRFNDPYILQCFEVHKVVSQTLSYLLIQMCTHIYMYVTCVYIHVGMYACVYTCMYTSYCSLSLQKLD